MISTEERVAEAHDLTQVLRRSGLKPLVLGGRSLLPIVQGGMGVGVSAHRLAGTVAGLGAVGTISSIDLRRHHADLMELTRGIAPGPAGTAASTTRSGSPTAIESAGSRKRSRSFEPCSERGRSTFTAPTTTPTVAYCIPGRASTARH